jgi:type II secretory pathway component PulC
MDLKIDKGLTAEEKLLRVIKKPTKSESIAAPTTNHHGPIRFSRKPFNSRDPIHILQRFFIVIFVCIVGFIFYRYFTEPINILVEEDPIHSVKNSKETNNVVSSETKKSFDEYAQELSGRDIFVFPWEQPVSEQPQSDNNAPVISLSSQMQIKGILLDKDPKVVIHEQASDETVILSVGESINGAVVKDIKEDKVTFSYNNQQVELTP